jgi:hypothetical protein
MEHPTMDDDLRQTNSMTQGRVETNPGDLLEDVGLSSEPESRSSDRPRSEQIRHSAHIAPSENHRDWDLSMSRIITIGAAVMLVMTAIIGVAAGQSGDDRVTDDDAIEEQERALRLLEELRTLADKDGVAISNTVFGSIRDDLAQGNTSYRAGAYANAQEHYHSASEQARSALVRSYTARTNLLLNASAGQLGALERRGFHTYEVNQLQEQVQRERDRLRAAESVAAARSSHDRAESIRAEVQALPTPTHVWIATRLVSPWAVAVVALLLTIGAIIGAAINRSIARGPGGPGGEIEIGGSFDD